MVRSGTATKPPKPPCWRDFVTPSFQSESEFTDISKIARSSTESFSSENSKTNKPKRIRARIHRTRSQFAIEEGDLPAEALTVTLAESKPDDIGLCRDCTSNDQIMQENNNRKCQTWLKNIEACKPLEDVGIFETAEADNVTDSVNCYRLCDNEREGISIEVPDDTLTYHSHINAYSRRTVENLNVSVSGNDSNMTFEKLHDDVIWTFSKTRVKHTSSLKSNELVNT